MKVNMLEAKSQLSRLVKAALAGEEVIIASNGTPMVRLVPLATNGGLRGRGRLGLPGPGGTEGSRPKTPVNRVRVRSLMARYRKNVQTRRRQKWRSPQHSSSRSQAPPSILNVTV